MWPFEPLSWQHLFLLWWKVLPTMPWMFNELTCLPNYFLLVHGKIWTSRLVNLSWDCTIQMVRYVDDTWVVIKQNEVDCFFYHINQVDPHIKFTQGGLKENKLAFSIQFNSIQFIYFHHKAIYKVQLQRRWIQNILLKKYDGGDASEARSLKTMHYLYQN